MIRNILLGVIGVMGLLLFFLYNQNESNKALLLEEKERYLKNEVMGSGIASKYIDPKAPEPPKGSGGGSGSKPPKVDNYAFQQSSKTYESINTTQLSKCCEPSIRS